MDIRSTPLNPLLHSPPLPIVTSASTVASILNTATSQSPAQYLPSDIDSTVLAGFTAQKTILTTNLATNSTGAFEIFHNNAGVLVAAILHPFSRGYVAISSADPFEEPIIDPRYGSNPLDIDIVVEGIKFQSRLIATPPMAELLPVQIAPQPALGDEALGAWVKLLLATNYHPSGTAAMMPLELGGVVDTSLKVYGTSNIRVVDGGMFPLLPGSHIGAAVYAVAEKAADLIKAEYA